MKIPTFAESFIALCLRHPKTMDRIGVVSMGGQTGWLNRPAGTSLGLTDSTDATQEWHDWMVGRLTRWCDDHNLQVIHSSLQHGKWSFTVEQGGVVGTEKEEEVFSRLEMLLIVVEGD